MAKIHDVGFRADAKLEIRESELRKRIQSCAVVTKASALVGLGSNSGVNLMLSMQCWAWMSHCHILIDV